MACTGVGKAIRILGGLTVAYADTRASMLGGNSRMMNAYATTLEFWKNKEQKSTWVATKEVVSFQGGLGPLKQL